MPNWCQNEIVIDTKDKQVMSELLDKFFLPVEVTDETDKVTTSPHLDFDKVIPMPTHIRENMKAGISDEWYHWSIKTWGCKWNILFADETTDKPTSNCGYTIYVNDTLLEIYFETAWSPPTGIASEIRNQFPQIDMSWFYREDNMQEAGWV